MSRDDFCRRIECERVWGLMGRGVEERTQKRDVGGFHAAIFLKLPSMAIFPWVVDRLLSKSALKNNAWNPPISLFCCFVSAGTLC